MDSLPQSRLLPQTGKPTCRVQEQLFMLYVVTREIGNERVQTTLRTCWWHKHKCEHKGLWTVRSEPHILALGCCRRHCLGDMSQLTPVWIALDLRKWTVCLSLTLQASLGHCGAAASELWLQGELISRFTRWMIYYYHIDNARLFSHFGEPVSPEAFLSGAHSRSRGAMFVCRIDRSTGSLPVPDLLCS